jgi:hypothetical protein
MGMETQRERKIRAVILMTTSSRTYDKFHINMYYYTQNKTKHDMMKIIQDGGENKHGTM